MDKKSKIIICLLTLNSWARAASKSGSPRSPRGGKSDWGFQWRVPVSRCDAPCGGGDAGAAGAAVAPPWTRQPLSLDTLGNRKPSGWGG